MKSRKKELEDTARSLNNFPIPIHSAKLGRSKYDFKSLAVGQSFPVDEEKRYSVSTLAKKFGDLQEPVWRFKVAMDENRDLRCWRIA